MAKIIDVVIVVDTEGLNREFPNGIGQHVTGNPQIIDRYYKVLVDKEHTYHDPNLPDTQGIICDVNDTIYFRAISKADNAHGVIILEFADKAEGVAAASLPNYLSIPSFRTSRKPSFSYNNLSQALPYVEWDGWKMWYATLEGPVDTLDPHMAVQALQSTSGLQKNHIRYTLGFRVTFPGTVRDYWFDPAIRIR